MATRGIKRTLTLNWRPANGEAAALTDDYIEVSGPVVSPAPVRVERIIEQTAFDGCVEEVDLNAVPAIFESAGQAIHVAFVVLNEEAQQDGMLRKALVRMLDSMGVRNAKLDEWLEQLRGTRSERINFGGLTTFDVRAQCALIMLAVRTRLPNVERWAVQAKYGKTECATINNQRRYWFVKEKADAITALAEWLAPSFPGMHGEALKCLVARYYSENKRVEISYRDLEKTFGGAGKSTYARANTKLVATLRPLVDQAALRLTPYFEEQRIVGNISERH